MSEFVHQRHKPPSRLPPHCELLLVCPPLRSNVNLSRIVRAAGGCGVRHIIACGDFKVDSRIARDSLEHIRIESRRSLQPVLKRLRHERYPLIGLEQTSNSTCLYDFSFPPRAALVVGHERQGLDQATLDLLDHVVEIPVFGRPYSYNVATATIMVLYEYCRQMTAGRGSESRVEP
ncbi:MAG: TrmH family RNA methyltransferase [Planctomycetota bacterium]